MIEYLPAISILIAIPFFCLSDWRTRTVPVWANALLYIVNVYPLFLYLSESPARNYYLLLLSCALVVIAFLLSFFGAIGGADFWFISAIMIFVQYNPFKFPRVFFPLDFFWTLLLTACYVPVLVFFYNKWKGNDLPVIKMFTTFPNGIPFMIPISFAFIVTLLIEIIL